jgi:hypothetical protein
MLASRVAILNLKDNLDERIWSSAILLASTVSAPHQQGSLAACFAGSSVRPSHLTRPASDRDRLSLLGGTFRTPEFLAASATATVGTSLTVGEHTFSRNFLDDDVGTSVDVAFLNACHASYAFRLYSVSVDESMYRLTIVALSMTCFVWYGAFRFATSSSCSPEIIADDRKHLARRSPCFLPPSLDRS